MAREDREPDLIALILEVVNPLLVMGLVGSLAFFLLDVGYRGRFDDQLRWTLFFFVFAIVLVVRICFTMGSNKAAGYGIALGCITFLAAMRFVEGLGVLLNLMIIFVIAGSAFLITRDTTWTPKRTRNMDNGIADALAEPWQLISTSRSRRRPHGLWVVWFTLAALPIIGIGQSLIPVEDVTRRQSAFWRITIFVGCGLGLLVTTALANLRRYLKVRKLKLPAAMAMRWIVRGSVIVVGAMIIAALMPRPQTETRILALTPWGSPEREANQFARRSQSAEKGEGDQGSDQPTSDVSRKSGGAKSQPNENAKGQSKSGDKGTEGERAGEKGSADRGNGKQGDRVGENDDSSQQLQPNKPTVLESVSSFLQSLIRWLVIVALLVLAAMFVLRFLANSHSWAAAWWKKLMSALVRNPSINSQCEVVNSLPLPPRLFQSYPNPFADGTADSRKGVELIRYTFAALEAWSRENGHSRGNGETVLEFARRVGELDHELTVPAERLVVLYSKFAYARPTKTARESEVAKAVWDAMDIVSVDQRNR